MTRCPWYVNRGFELERIVLTLAAIERLEPTPPHRPKGEQIDGMFVVDFRPLLLEARWRKAETTASDVFAFQGKLRGKLRGTLGLIVSASGYSDDAPDALVYGKEIDVVLADLTDIELALAGELGKVIRVKLREAASRGSHRQRVLFLSQMAGPAEPLKLAFLVEGNADKEFLDALIPRLSADVSFRVVRAGGRAALPLSFPTVAELVDSGYKHVIVLGDADSSVTDDVARYRSKLEQALKRPGVEKATHICLAVPMLEAWLLPAKEDAYADPKRELAKRNGESPDVARLTRELSVEDACALNKSFDTFIKVVRKAAGLKTSKRRGRRLSGGGRKAGERGQRLAS